MDNLHHGDLKPVNMDLDAVYLQILKDTTELRAAIPDKNAIRRLDDFLIQLHLWKIETERMSNSLQQLQQGLPEEANAAIIVLKAVAEEIQNYQQNPNYSSGLE